MHKIKLAPLVVFAALVVGALPARADDVSLCAGIDDNQAVGACTRLLTKKNLSGTDRASYLEQRGVSYSNNGDDDRAIADYNKAIELTPDYVEAFYSRGVSYGRKGDDDRAIADYNKAIELRPDYAHAFFKRGVSYSNKGDDDRAIADYSKAIELKPDDADAFNNRGFAYGHKGDDDRAIADYSKAIELKPNYQLALNNLEAARKALADKANASTPPPVVSASQTQPANTQQAALAPAMASPKPAPAPASAAPLRRVALVIGNSAYRSVPGLPNPQHDADLVASSLRTAGIDVTVVHDADRSALLSALNSFADKADGADWAIIYYAGHGIEMDGHNYLVPVDATITSDRTITDETISLDRMMSAANGARQLKLVVIDACRNNPFKPKMTVAHRSIDRGLSRVEPEDGTLVVYAAKEGTLAKDGEGDDSPFALSFAKRILEPGVEINMAMRFVRQDVLEATGREQEPFVYGSLPPVNYYFVTGK